MYGYPSVSQFEEQEGAMAGCPFQAAEGSTMANPPAAENKQENIIRVSSKSRSTAVAGAIAAVIRNIRKAEVQAIGAGAVNQAVKALAIAGTYLQDDQIRIVNSIYFVEIEIDGAERTAVRFSVVATT